MKGYSRISGEKIRDYRHTVAGRGVGKKASLCLHDMLHLPLMHGLRLTDAEYDRFLENISGTEVDDIIIKEDWSISDKRKIIEAINKLK